MAMNVDWSDRPKEVYIRDDVYAWLPAKLTSKVLPTDKTVTVELSLPADWHQFTSNSSHPSLAKSTTTVDAEGNTDEKRILRKVKLSDYKDSVLPLQNVDKDGNLIGKNDLADLHFLHEAAVLYNLKDRHSRGVPYTRVGDIIIAVNPFDWIDGLYSKETKELYAKKLIWNVQKDDTVNYQSTLDGYFQKLEQEPHVYETSCHAYRGVAVDGQNQTILVSGISGAGKTETVKIVMNHLAQMHRSRPIASQKEIIEKDEVKIGAIVQKVIESNPVFEAFGNAKTVRNDNSSRFGKFTKLFYDVEDIVLAEERGEEVPKCVLIGSSFETYLLEKSRVVHHDIGETTYHIFYQLLSAGDDSKDAIWKELKGLGYDSFRYVGEPAVNGEIQELSYADAWEATKSGLELLGFSGENFTIFMQAICIVMQLGNITFGPDPTSDNGSIVTSVEELTKLSDLIGISSEVIESALTTNMVKAGFEWVTKKLNSNAASETCDAWAKEIYARLFEKMVEKINNATHIGNLGNQSRWISLLDLFGFECFDKNRFEQLCINYANEKLQQKYVTDTFSSVQAEYESEGIELYDFSSTDNSDVVELIESRVGLISILNEECIRPAGNDKSFVYKIKSIHKESPKLISKALDKPTEFRVKHFAGVVTYDAMKFVERNADTLSKDVIACSLNSSNEYIQTIFGVLLKERDAECKKRGKKRKTICSSFKSQLSELVHSVEESKTRYIRCIKPNDGKEPRVMSHPDSMSQLSSAGLVTAITISHETFPDRVLYEVLWGRFKCLLLSDNNIDSELPVKEKAEVLLRIIFSGEKKKMSGIEVEPYACGKTKVFFRSGSLEVLEASRLALYNAKASYLQAIVKRRFARRKYLKTLELIITLQTWIRCRMSRKLFLRMRQAAITVQCVVRMGFAKSELDFRKKYKATTLIQSKWRARKSKSRLYLLRNAAMVIQRSLRAKRDKTSLNAGLAVLVNQLQKDHQMKQLLMKLANLDGRDDKDELLKECALMIGYLGGELYRERSKVSDLRAQLTEEKVTSKEKDLKKTVVEGTLVIKKDELELLRKQNLKLTSRLNDYKISATKAQHLIKNMRNAQDVLKTEQEKSLKRERSDYEREINELNMKLQTEKEKRVNEISECKLHLALSEKRRLAEVRSLKRENQELAEGHNKDLTQLIQALESSYHESEVVSDIDEGEINELKKKVIFLESKLDECCPKWKAEDS